MKGKIGLNLLFISQGLRGGTVTYPRELLQALARRDEWELIVYTQPGAFRLGAEHDNVRYREVGPFANAFHRVLYEQVVLPFRARRDDIDVLFSPGFVSPLVGRFKKIVTVHDLYYKIMPHVVRKWQRRYWSLMVPLSLRICDGVIAVSDTTANDLTSAYPWVRPKLHRVWSGTPVLISRWEPVPNVPAGKYVLVVGNITPNKNINVVIRAMEILAYARPGISLKVVGCDVQGQLGRTLGEMTGRLAIKLHANVSDEDLAGMYRAALCTVVASVYEGFGFPLLEAMANGCPVVTSGGGALREVAGDAALFFRHDSPRELAEAVMRLNEDPALRAALVRRGYDNLDRFSWERNAHDVSDIFEGLLSAA